MSAPSIYCISLASSIERRERMRRRLAHHGLLDRTRFIDAVESEVVRDFSPQWKDSAGRACSVSHLRAMRALLSDPESSRTGAIICEDDVLFHNRFGERLAAVLRNLPADAPFCTLGYLISTWSSDFHWAGRGPERHNLCRWVPGSLWGTHMYWISPAYARLVLEAYGSRPVSELSSMPEHLLMLRDGFASFPSLCLQDAIDSDIRPPSELDFHLSGQAAWRYSDYAECESGEDVSPLRHQEGLPAPTIALCMIVRDEEAVIERCLRSVMPLIDSWQICDTGSRDATREIICDALGHLPGALHERPWRDFGWNRSELMALAAGRADYLLLLDADITIDWRGPLPPLEADAYLLRVAGELDYATPRLVRGSRRWRYEGSTHEYLTSDHPYSQVRLEALLVEHHADGGTRTEKFTRDAALLERDLARRPDDHRTLFYLAQTCRDLGNTRRAIELYERRASLGGWEEEVFYSLFQAGTLLAREDDDRAMRALLAAWQNRPQRAEPLYELVRLLRFRRLHQAAHVFAQRALEIGYPDDLLFVHRWIYDWGLRFELSLTSYWVGEIDRALELSRELLEDGRLPSNARAAVKETIAHCRTSPAVRTSSARRTRPLLHSLCPSFNARPLELALDTFWPQFNPTIAPDGEGFRMIVRTANYEIHDGAYRFLTDDEAIRTTNYLARLDGELNVIEAIECVDTADAPLRYPSRVRGYEDCRLVRLADGWAATATVRDRNPVERCETALLSLDGPRIRSVRILNGPWPGRHEKNWMPFVADGRLHVVYDCDPTIVLRYEERTGVPELVSEAAGPPGLNALRGGSQGASIADGLLFVVHEAVDDGGRRGYVHRFVLLDDDYVIAAGSPAFSFTQPGIEFCAGLARQGDRLVLTFGIGDRSAALGVVDLGEAMALLEPV